MSNASQNNNSTPIPLDSVTPDPPSIDSGNKDVGANDPLKKQSKKLTSKVWKDFDREVYLDSVTKTAICKHCKRKFNAANGMGTTHLRNHLAACKHKPKSGGDIRQRLMGPVKSGDDLIPKFGNHKFDPEVEKALFAQMIARHDYPFLMAEHEYFRYWLSYCMPTYKFRSRNTVKNDLKKSFNNEKEKLYKNLEKFSSRISLITGVLSIRELVLLFNLSLHR